MYNWNSLSNIVGDFMANTQMKTIIFAGGCFWGVEKAFSLLNGVCETEVGYANGNIENPTYELVCENNTGFKEACKIVYNPEVISLKKLLKAFFICINPTERNKQGNDIGTQYQTGVYYLDGSDLEIIKEYFEEEKKKYPEFYVELESLKNFYPAEEYHQKYLDKVPNGYCHVSKNEMDMIVALNEVEI